MSFKSKMQEVADQAIYERAIDRASKKSDQPTTTPTEGFHLTQQEYEFLDLLAKMIVKQIMHAAGQPYKEEDQSTKENI